MNTSTTSLLPHHRLRVYRVALEFLRAVRGIRATKHTTRTAGLRGSDDCRNQKMRCFRAALPLLLDRGHERFLASNDFLEQAWNPQTLGAYF